MIPPVKKQFIPVLLMPEMQNLNIPPLVDVQPDLGNVEASTLTHSVPLVNWKPTYLHLWINQFHILMTGNKYSQQKIFCSDCI